MVVINANMLDENVGVGSPACHVDTCLSTGICWGLQQPCRHTPPCVTPQPPRPCPCLFQVDTLTR
jgi:hypothetical protein